MNKPVNITCAPTGGIHTPPMSKHLPITPTESAQTSIESAEAGASMNMGSMNFGIFPMKDKYTE
nr:3-keto-5-aminohexanoate cleavage protein [uncultured Roseovarius sp.]